MTARGSLAAPDGYDTLVTVGVSLQGPVAIWASAAGEALTAYSADGELSAVVPVRNLGVAHPHVDLLPDGSFLVVGARCWWREGGPERNAVVYDAHGQVVRRGCLGDGIEHVQVASDGTIWAGYFDEGVFGNYGWGGPGPDPLGAHGIVAWTQELEKAWQLDGGLVFDCYALNVTGTEVLACPYLDFPVVRIRAGRVTVTPTQGVEGPKGIVTSGHRVGFIGAYDRPWQLDVADASDNSFTRRARYRLRGSNGERLPPGHLHCRGSVAHLFAGPTWLTFDLDTLA